MLKTPSALLSVHNLLKVPLTRTKRDHLPGWSTLLPGFCESKALYQPAGHWDELGRDTKHKKYCCGMMTLMLKGENFTGSGEWPLQKTKVNHHLPAPAGIPWCACCLQRLCCIISPGTMEYSMLRDLFTLISVALIPYLIFLGPPDSVVPGAWTELRLQGC